MFLFLTVSSRIRVGEEESGYEKSGEGGGERLRLAEGAVGCCVGFGSWCRDVGFSTPQLLLAVLPQIFVSSSAAEGRTSNPGW